MLWNLIVMAFQFLTVSKRAILVPGITDSLRCNCPQVKVTVFLFHYSVHCVEFACYVIVGGTINSNVGIAIFKFSYSTFLQFDYFVVFEKKINWFLPRIELSRTPWVVHSSLLYWPWPNTWFLQECLDWFGKTGNFSLIVDPLTGCSSLDVCTVF